MLYTSIENLHQTSSLLLPFRSSAGWDLGAEAHFFFLHTGGLSSTVNGIVQFQRPISNSSTKPGLISFKMLSRRKLVALVAVQQMMVEIVVALTIFVYVFKFLRRRRLTRRKRGHIRYSINTKIPQQGCLGALDGTYIDVRVPEEDKGRYRTRKGHISVNVLGVCNMNMQFIYVLTGWEGSAADSRVLRDAVTRPHGLRVPTDPLELEIPDTTEPLLDGPAEFISTIETNPTWSNWRNELAESMYNEWLNCNG
ncbi:UNVERIFIED_CONTAM: hypothetical protein Sradi_5310200 [Sesamum radiatum]|uniref:DDE Tnp4 domain-containing protein n=1 Tax=Sesamum radiatum TaxID=300843 RepID=A0AAW2LQ60_SESRA